jgi:hypothetical protein
MAVSFVVRSYHVAVLHSWYEEVGKFRLHTRLKAANLHGSIWNHISKIPGWRPSWRFQLIEPLDQSSSCEERLAVHDFDVDNGLGGTEHERAKSAPWRSRIPQSVGKYESRIFDFTHFFDARVYCAPTETDVKELEQCICRLK